MWNTKRLDTVIISGTRWSIALTLLLGAAATDTLSGRVVGVTDGDTLTLLDAKFQQHNIRLVGIDASESEQPFGTRAKQHLNALVFGKTVTIEYDAQDHYGRMLGKVLFHGEGINLKQIHAGLAWHYKAYERDQSPTDRERYAAAEENARKPM